MMVNAMVRLNVYPSSVRHAILYNPDDENYHRSQKFIKLILKHFVTRNCNGHMPHEIARTQRDKAYSSAVHNSLNFAI
jgi:hypothetical protein